jgi:hypothetical protein
MKFTNILPRLGAALLVTVFLNGSVLALFNHIAMEGSQQSDAAVARQA